MAHGFESEMLAGLVRNGLASAIPYPCEPVGVRLQGRGGAGQAYLRSPTRIFSAFHSCGAKPRRDGPRALNANFVLFNGTDTD